jgi:hypothetical protein
MIYKQNYPQKIRAADSSVLRSQGPSGRLGSESYKLQTVKHITETDIQSTF